MANGGDRLTRRGEVPNGSQDLVIDQLRTENRKLKLYLAAVIRLLVSKGAISKEEVARFIEVIDAEDGVVDGEFTGDIL